MACYIHVTVWIWTDTALTQRATYHVPPAGQQILSWSGSSLSPLDKSESAVNLGVPRSLVDPHTGHFGPRWPARSPSFSGFLSPVFVMYASQNRIIENKRPDTVQLGFRFEFTLLQKKDLSLQLCTAFQRALTFVSLYNPEFLSTVWL